MSTTKAPTLFGKRTTESQTGYEFQVMPGLVLQLVESPNGRWFIRFPGFDGHGTTWPTAGDAARIGEYHLSKLHAALGKVVGHEGE